MLKNWKIYKLKDIANLSTGFAFKSKDYELSGNIKVIRGKNITEGYLRWNDDSRYWNHSTEKLEKYVVKLDDIVIGMDGSKIGKNRAIVRESDLPSILAQRVGRVQSKEGISCQKFLWQLINNNNFEIYIENVKTGTSIPHISLGQIGNLEVNLPPLKEQKAIANILSVIDDKIENNLSTNKTLEDMAMALYKHWFVDFGPFQDGEFIESELGLIPKGWEVKRLEELLEIKYGKDHKKLKEGNIPVYGSGGIMRYADTFLYNKESILIPRKGTLSNLFYITEPFWSVDTMFYSIIKNSTFGKYIFHFLKSLDLASMDVGSAVPSLTTSLLKRIDVIVPAVSEIENFDIEISRFFKEMKLNKDESQTLTKLRDTLLPKLISGEIRLKEFREQVETIL
jgi:type I restriction enzyme S subunit